MNLPELQATPADYQELLEQMPMARERLAVIILSRMLAESETDRAELRAKLAPPNSNRE